MIVNWLRVYKNCFCFFSRVDAYIILIFVNIIWFAYTLKISTCNKVPPRMLLRRNIWKTYSTSPVSEKAYDPLMAILAFQIWTAWNISRLTKSQDKNKGAALSCSALDYFYFMRFCFCEISRFKPSFTDPSGMHNSGKKKKEKAFTNSKIQRLICLIQVELGTDWKCDFLFHP